MKKLTRIGDIFFKWKDPVLFLVIFSGVISSFQTGPPKNWQPLFNGENLDGWTIKIAGHELNENYNNTFRVEDGLLKVSYADYDTFNNDFGHIFYNEKFSHYKVRVEYRFVGEQLQGGPSWAFLNNGIMFHAQSPDSMELNQDFPVSIEAQLLGGIEGEERPNFGVCTPGTDVEIDGVLRTEHCISSNAKTYTGDQWVTAELYVYGDSVIHHILGQDTVLTYQHPQLSESGELIDEGFIALQAESHPTEFRKIEILDLSDTFNK
ncbi:3-keto-disaccharide hydrolase [Marinilabilia rubra]|uniref:DUF1080 domain-containing protein n=1 Tax=Marinilabilia rubra TaxID=2162893 RepID=A0A2U2B780_9BACT|nr:DUF1080 domain-containing protein [Marinilabilia rubra]PWD98894.1 DUF1080 domain-containing protein [Marinilabilia rubra]